MRHQPKAKAPTPSAQLAEALQQLHDASRNVRVLVSVVRASDSNKRDGDMLDTIQAKLIDAEMSIARYVKRSMRSKSAAT
jgi:hypothetical protein